ncbi:MAG: dihydroorotate dehydrogenase electron transfer subunit [Sarcina sp.]
MDMEYISSIIIENTEISQGIFSMKLKHKKDVKAGQFYMLKGLRSYLGRPISVCEVDNDIIRFVYAVVGTGTQEMKDLRIGDKISLIGPLGNGFNVEKSYNKTALVAGGIGIALMLELSKNLNKNNINIDLYAGFRDKPYLLDDIKPYVNEVYLTTDTGKVGKKGFITEILLENIKKYDTVLCCGPEIMMSKVVEICKENNINVYISMEKHMACGVGACLVCTCKTKNGNKRTCKDGPVFNGLDVEF